MSEIVNYTAGKTSHVEQEWGLANKVKISGTDLQGEGGALLGQQRWGQFRLRGSYIPNCNEGNVLFGDVKRRGILKLSDFFQANGGKKLSKKHSEGSSALERSSYKTSKSITRPLLCPLGLPIHM